MPRLRKPNVGALTAAEFKSELRRLNLTQQWFAEQSGLELVTVSKWATGDNPVPQYAYFILQLLDRLAYRGEVNEVHHQVEAFVRMITAQTLAPSAVLRDASTIMYTGKRAIEVDPAPPRPYRVTWQDPKTHAFRERWYTHDTTAYRRKRTLRDLGIEATLCRVAG